MVPSQKEALVGSAQLLGEGMCKLLRSGELHSPCRLTRTCTLQFFKHSPPNTPLKYGQDARRVVWRKPVPNCHRRKPFVAEVASLLLALTTAGTAAQERSLARDGIHSSKLLILHHLAPTGAVVPKLGDPQLGPTTGINRRAQEQDDHVTHSICTNCGLN